LRDGSGRQGLKCDKQGPKCDNVRLGRKRLAGGELGACERIRVHLLLAPALILACGGTAAPEFGPGWSPGPPLPEPVQEFQAAVLRDRVYVAGGLHRGNSVGIAVYRLDPAAGSWQRVANLPDGRHHMPLAATNDSLYAIGGLGPGGMNPTATLWVYDESANRWMTRASLPEPRGASAAGVVDGHIIVVGGMGSGEVLLDSVAIYDPATDRWRHGAPIPTPRDHLAAAVVNGKLYAVGGRPLDPSRNFDRLERYDLATDSWTTLAPMPTARGGLAAAALSGTIHTFGGETRRSVFREHEVYDVAAGTWASAALLPTGRHGLAAAAIDGRLYAIGGGPRAGLAQTAAVEVFQP
jgi:N-acetylneuraminic acid mutarotase